MNLFYRRVKWVLTFLISLLAVVLIQQISPSSSTSGGISNLARVAILVMGMSIPFYTVRTYRLKNLCENISDLDEKELGELRPGLNAVNVYLESENPVKAPISGNNVALAKVTVNSFNYWSIFAERILDYSRLFLSNGRNKIAFSVDQNCRIKMPGFEEESDYVSGLGSPEDSVKQFEQKNSVNNTSFRRGYVEKGVKNSEDLTIIGDFEEGNNGIQLTSSEKLPAIISKKGLSQLTEHYKNRKKRNAAITSVLIIAVTAGTLLPL
ncbi:hypothetical protein ACK3SF_05675 [Candidatus Nanosalina sp. VS9-1]|uniref:hypothetical protein n=1 Tax=Candidatus Nanosalina sp. VS9-1 TaxID=3388566 RepID=UPI0039E0C6AD